jgi:hypothetical protein
MSGFFDDTLTVVGAYGRAANEQDWLEGKDFKVYSGPYFSIRDLEEIKGYGTKKIVFLNNDGFVEFTKEL